jgi:predicted nucleotidyltransferase
MHKKYKNILINIIQKVIPGCKVYLFGSRARKEHDSGADIDLALDAGKEIESKKLSLIREQIEETTLPLSVDIVDLFTAPEILKNEIKSEGILWKISN